MSGHSTIRALRYAAYCAAALVALLVAAAFAVPLFLDTPAVERELKAKLSQLVQGEIAWERLSIRLLPSPRGSLSGFTAEIPGTASVRAGQVDALLRLLPLLRGRAEIASVSLSRPEVRLEIAPPSPAPAGSKPAEEAPSDPVEGYRSAVDAIRRFAPNAELDVEDGLIDVVLPEMPAVKLRQLELHGETGSKGMTLKVTAASDAWSRLELRASVDFSDLSGAAKLDISRLKVQDWIDRFLDKSPVRVAVPEATLRVDARSDGKTRIQADFVVLATTAEVFRASERVRLPDVAIAGGVTANREEISLRLTRARLGASRLELGSLRYGLKSASLTTVADFDLDLAQAADTTRRLLPQDLGKALAPFQKVSGRAQGQARFELRRSVWNAAVDVRKWDSVVIEGLSLPVKLAAAGITANGEEITVRLAGAQLGASSFGEYSLRYGLKDGSLACSADFDLDLAQAMAATRRLLPEDAGKALAQFQKVSGRAQGQAKFDMRGSGWNAAVDIRKSDSSAGIEGLPGSVGLAAARVSVTGETVQVERADVTMLDARALASATIGYGKQLRIEGTVSDASVGEALLAWIGKTAGVPPRFALRTPIKVAVQSAVWGSGQPLDLKATAAFEGGPGVDVDLSWSPALLDLRRAAIKDAKSDANLALRLEKGVAQGRFSGTLQSASIGAALKGAKLPSGGASGDLRFRVDLARLERATVTGKLEGDSVDLAWLLGRPVAIERVDVQADGQKLRIREATVVWAQQRFALSGEVARAPDGVPVIEAQLTSPGVLVDALLPEKSAKEPEPAKKGNEDDEPLWKQWPLPVRGRIALRAGFVQHGERRAEPVVATLTLEAQRASLELQQVRLCGISFPLTAEARPEGLLSFSVQITAQKQPLEQSARCLTERGVQMTGEFDLSAQLRSSGKRSELLRNLDGKVEVETRNGRVRQFPLIFKILSLRDVADSLKKDGVSLGDAGFPYLSIAMKGRFDRGKFIADESAFRSDSVGFAARGSISLSDKPPKPYDSDLTVLVAPLSRLDSLVRALPLVGYIVGGTLTSWPVRVTQDIRDPKVEALSPSAITSEFVGMFQRTLKLPEKLLPKLGSPGAP